MFDRINSAFERVNAGLDRVAMLPVAFMAILGVFILATAAFDADGGAMAAARLLQLPA